MHGYAICAKRYGLLEGSKIIEVKGHGLGYLMSPASRDEPDWMQTAWRYILRLDGVPCGGSDPAWLDYPAMMKIPVSSPAVLGRLKGFCKPFDFVLTPILRRDKLDPEDYKAKVYTNGRVSADPKTLRALAEFSEREINKGTGLSRRIIRQIRHNGQVKSRTMQRITDFLTRKFEAGGQGRP